MVEIRKPANVKVIDEVWIGMSEDADGKNGIVAAYAPGIGGTPMLTASEKVLELFKRQAGDAGRFTDTHVKIYRFVRAECVYDPRSN